MNSWNETLLGASSMMLNIEKEQEIRFPCTSEKLNRLLEQHSTQDAVGAVFRMITIMVSGLHGDVDAMMFCINLIGKLIRKLIESGAPGVIVQRSLRQTLTRAIQIIQEPSTPLRISLNIANEDSMILLLSNKLVHFNRILTAETASFASKLVYKSFSWAIKSAEFQKHFDNESSIPDIDLKVLYNTIVGPSLDFSTIFNNTILMDIPVSKEFTIPASTSTAHSIGYIVVLYSCSLEVSYDAHISLELNGAGISHSSVGGVPVERTYLQAFAEYLAKSNVTVVASQQRVHPYLQRQLSRRGIKVVQRVSIRYMSALQNLSGARIQYDLPALHHMLSAATLEPSILGFLQEVYCKYLFGKLFVVAVGYKDISLNGDKTDNDDTVDADGEDDDDKDTRSQKVSHARKERFLTHLLDQFVHLNPRFLQQYVRGVIHRQHTYHSILLTAPSEVVLKAWKTSFEQCMELLRSLSLDTSCTAYALPGNGIWQAYVARKLKVSDNEQKHQNTENLRIQRKFDTVAAAFISSLKDCAVLASLPQASANKYYQSYGSEEIFEWFHCSAGAKTSPLHEQESHRIVFRNPVGDKVCVERCGEDSKSQFILSPITTVSYNANMVGRNDLKPPPLDSYSSYVLAMKIAVDAVCALIDVDDVVYINATAN